MTQIGKREFLQHASRYLKKVEETGEEVIITHRDKVQLKIVPIKPKTIDDLRGKLKIRVVKGNINDPIFLPFDKW